MYKFITSFLVISLALFGSSFADQNESNESTVSGSGTTKPNVLKNAYIIPIRDQIGPPILDILRRGMKEAISAEVDLVILDMDTPGESLVLP